MITSSISDEVVFSKYIEKYATENIAENLKTKLNEICDEIVSYWISQYDFKSMIVEKAKTHKLAKDELALFIYLKKKKANEKHPSQ